MHAQPPILQLSSYFTHTLTPFLVGAGTFQTIHFTIIMVHITRLMGLFVTAVALGLPSSFAAPVDGYDQLAVLTQARVY
jgi:hypothetical protein